MKLIISGAGGAMGHAIAEYVQDLEDMTLVAGVDRIPLEHQGFPIYADFTNLDEKADVLVDFSHPTLLAPLLDYAVATGIPAVIGTTGLNEAHEDLLVSASKKIAILQSSNMSLGIALMKRLARECAQALPDFDIEIVEAHHHRKVDAPSGTANMLYDTIAEVRRHTIPYYARHGGDTKRNPEEITLHSIRAGNLVGEHQLWFGGMDELITITHRAQSRRIFVSGAMKAATFVCQAAPGRYTIDDVLGGSL